MKRLIVISVVFALVAGAVFAQHVPDGVGLGFWGRVAFVPLEAQIRQDGAPEGHDKDTDNATAIGQSWGGHYGRPARVQFSGNSDGKVGFDLWLQTDGGSVGIGDYASIWAKPFDFLRVDLGQFNGAELAGKIGDTDFHKFTVNQRFISEGHGIFTRFDARPGFLLSISPVEAFYLGFALPNVGGFGWAGATAQAGTWSGGVKKELEMPDPDDPNSTLVFEGDVKDADSIPQASEAWRYFQVGMGYKIDNVGHIRLGYFAGDMREPQYDIMASSRIEAAFALTMLEGMVFDLGVKIPIPFTAKDDADKAAYGDKAHSAPALVVLGADANIGDFGLYAVVEGAFGAKNGDDKWKSPALFNIHLIPSYNLGVATIGLELGMELQTAASYDGTKVEHKEAKEGGPAAEGGPYFDFGAGLWIKKGLGQGHIKAGLSYTALDTKSRYGTGSDDAKNQVTGYFRIPIVAEIYFF
jgi:hypothetical protein